MDILHAAAQLRFGTSWNLRGDLLEQAEDETPRVSVPTLAELQPVMDSDTTPAAILADEIVVAVDAFLNSAQPISKIERAVALVTMDRINIIHAWLMEFKTEVVSAVSLADLRTRVATLNNLPQFQPVDIKTAIRNKLESGGGN